MAVTPADGISRMNRRPVQVLHGTADSRVAYNNARDLIRFASARGQQVALHSFEGADHIEGLLLEPDRYQAILVDFFERALTD